MDRQFATLGIKPMLGKTDRAGSPESRYIGKLISEDPDLTRRAAPSTYIDSLEPTMAPTFFIQHGTDDANVPLLQSRNFAKALEAALGSEKVIYHLIDGAGHGTPEFSSTANLDRVFAFLKRTLDVDSP